MSTSTLVFWLAVDRDGTRAGVGHTSAWARFDAARCAFDTCYALNDWPSREAQPMRVWAESLPLTKVSLQGEVQHLALAALLETTPDSARVIFRGFAGLRDEIGDPPWKVLPRQELDEKRGEWVPVDHTELYVARDGRWTFDDPLRRLHTTNFTTLAVQRLHEVGDVWRLSCGLPVEPGDQLEIYHNGAFRLDHTDERWRDVVPHSWLAVEITEPPSHAEESNLLWGRSPRLGVSVAIRAAGSLVLPLRRRGGITEPVLDPHPIVDGREEWRAF